MGNFIKTVAGYRIYKLTLEECKQYSRAYPCYVTWKYEDDIGNMDLTENESETLNDMVKWCSKKLYVDNPILDDIKTALKQTEQSYAFIKINKLSIFYTDFEFESGTNRIIFYNKGLYTTSVIMNDIDSITICGG